MHHILCFLSTFWGFMSCAPDSRLAFLLFNQLLRYWRRQTLFWRFFDILSFNRRRRLHLPFLSLSDLQFPVDFRNHYICLAKWNFERRPRCLYIIICYIIVGRCNIKEEYWTTAARVVWGNSCWSRVDWLPWILRRGAPEVRPLPAVSFALEIRHRRSIRIHQRWTSVSERDINVVFLTYDCHLFFTMTRFQLIDLIMLFCVPSSQYHILESLNISLFRWGN